MLFERGNFQDIENTNNSAKLSLCYVCFAKHEKKKKT